MEEMILKKDARILFNDSTTNDGVKISELIVAEFKDGDEANWPRHLYKKYDKDFGNCNFSSWDKCSLAHVLLILYASYGFKDEEVEAAALMELTKIKEFNKDIIQFLRGPFDDWENYDTQQQDA
jgi:hypothetical protein